MTDSLLSIPLILGVFVISSCSPNKIERPLADLAERSCSGDIFPELPHFKGSGFTGNLYLVQTHNSEDWNGEKRDGEPLHIPHEWIAQNSTQLEAVVCYWTVSSIVDYCDYAGGGRLEFRDELYFFTIVETASGILMDHFVLNGTAPAINCPDEESFLSFELEGEQTLFDKTKSVFGEAPSQELEERIRNLIENGS